MTNQAIADKFGVAKSTAWHLRDSVVANETTETRVGKDGKSYPAKRKSPLRIAKSEERPSGRSENARLYVDERTGEVISHYEAAKRRGAEGATRDLQDEVAALRAEVERLRSEHSPSHSLDDLRRIDAVTRRVQRITTDTDTYKLLKRCLHPDSRNSVSDEMLHKAWQVFNAMEPVVYEASNLPPPLPTLEEMIGRRMETIRRQRKPKYRSAKKQMAAE